MPRLTKSIPTYRKHRASGQAVVTLNGQDHYLGPHGTRVSRDEFDRLIAEWLANGRQTVAPESEKAPMTVVELAAAYSRYAKGYYRKEGKPTREYELIVEALRIVCHLYGRKPVAVFGCLALKAVQQQMIGRRWTRCYINNQMNRIRRMFKWAASCELCSVTVYQSLSTVPGLRAGRSDAKESEPVSPVADAVVEATLPHLPDVVGDMVRLQRLLGCRPGEICNMRPCDVDRSGDVWLYRPGTHKTLHHGKDRVIAIGPKAQGVLKPYLLRATDAYCFSPAESEHKRRRKQHASRKTPLSCGNRPGTNRQGRPQKSAGDCYTNDSFRRAIHRACHKAGIPQWSPNRLRHSAATEIRKRYGLEAAQVVLGHSNAAITQVYAERDLSLAVRVAAECG